MIDGLRPIMEPWSYIFNFLQPRDCLTVFGVRLGGFHSRWIMSVLMQPALLCLLVAPLGRPLLGYLGEPVLRFAWTPRVACLHLRVARVNSLTRSREFPYERI